MSSRRDESVHLDFTGLFYETVTVAVVDDESVPPCVDKTKMFAVYDPDGRPNIAMTVVAFPPAGTLTVPVNVPCCPPEFERTATTTAVMADACALETVALIATGIADDRDT